MVNPLDILPGLHDDFISCQQVEAIDVEEITEDEAERGKDGCNPFISVAKALTSQK